MSSSELRERKKAPEEVKKPLSKLVQEEDSTFGFLDVLRTIVFIGILSAAVSYFVTRESFVWGVQRPQWTRVEVVKSWLAGPKQYTDADLKAYDGSDPTLPILLAINGTIYDVTSGRKFYGPGGSYHFFAGADASRAFVTSCFDTDINPDMRGVEEMFLPIDDPEIDALYTSGELKKLKEQERRNAKKQVYEALSHWTEFFGGSKKYHRVGEVKRVKGWETMGPAPTLCPKAREGRSKRARPEGK